MQNVSLEKTLELSIKSIFRWRKLLGPSGRRSINGCKDGNWSMMWDIKETELI